MSCFCLFDDGIGHHASASGLRDVGGGFTAGHGGVFRCGDGGHGGRLGGMGRGLRGGPGGLAGGRGHIAIHVLTAAAGEHTAPQHQSQGENRIAFHGISSLKICARASICQTAKLIPKKE